MYGLPPAARIAAFSAWRDRSTSACRSARFAFAARI